MQATHADFAGRLYGRPEVVASPRFSKPKLDPTGFTIEHYAGGVSYRTENFLAKNRDFVVAEHQTLLQESSSPFTRLLFPVSPDANGDMVRAQQAWMPSCYITMPFMLTYHIRVSLLWSARHSNTIAAPWMHTWLILRHRALNAANCSEICLERMHMRGTSASDMEEVYLLKEVTLLLLAIILLAPGLR